MALGIRLSARESPAGLLRLRVNTWDLRNNLNRRATAQKDLKVQSAIELVLESPAPKKIVREWVSHEIIPSWQIPQIRAAK